MFDFWINNFSAFPVMKDASSHFKSFFVDSLSYDVCIIKKPYITSPRICLICLAATSSLAAIYCLVTRLLYLVVYQAAMYCLGTRLLWRSQEAFVPLFYTMARMYFFVKILINIFVIFVALFIT